MRNGGIIAGLIVMWSFDGIKKIQDQEGSLPNLFFVIFESSNAALQGYGYD